MALIRNLSRYHELHPIIGNQMHSPPLNSCTFRSRFEAGFHCVRATSLSPEVKQVLPELVEMLPEVDDEDDTQLPVGVTAGLCNILNNLSQSDKQHVKAVINEGGLPKIIGISTCGSSDNGSV